MSSGLWEKRELTVPSLKGWLVIFLSVTVLSIVTLWMLGRYLHDFLARHAPVQTDVMVVEGWVPMHILEWSASEYREGNYRIVLTTGGRMLSKYCAPEYDNWADFSAFNLKKLGVSQDRVVPVPSLDVKRNRTIASAVALRNWIEQHPELKIQSFNIVTRGVHARRSLMAFEKAFEDSKSIGVIPVDSILYDKKDWYRSTVSVKLVLHELMGLLSLLSE